MKLSFVIPCYCSEATLEMVVSEIICTMDETSYEYEIVLINDCSPDGTFDIIEDICKIHKTIIGIDFAKKFWTACCTHGRIKDCIRRYCNMSG